jgi:hypothetical protein
MDEPSKTAYIKTIKKLSERVNQLKPKVGNPEELTRISDCLNHVLKQTSL